MPDAMRRLRHTTLSGAAPAAVPGRPVRVKRAPPAPRGRAAGLDRRGRADAVPTPSRRARADRTPARPAPAARPATPAGPAGPAATARRGARRPHHGPPGRRRLAGDRRLPRAGRLAPWHRLQHRPPRRSVPARAGHHRRHPAHRDTPEQRRHPDDPGVRLHQPPLPGRRSPGAHRGPPRGGTRCSVTWTATFRPLGPDGAALAAQFEDGVFEPGLEALATRGRDVPDRS